MICFNFPQKKKKKKKKIIIIDIYLSVYTDEHKHYDHLPNKMLILHMLRK